MCVNNYSRKGHKFRWSKDAEGDEGRRRSISDENSVFIYGILKNLNVIKKKHITQCLVNINLISHVKAMTAAFFHI